MSESPPFLRDSFAMERRDRIWRLVNERGRVRTSELAQLFSVTEPTIRKDIAALESRQLLRRAHGGAVARTPMTEVSIPEREHKYIAEKRIIARECLRMLNHGDAIFLDGGTTNLQLALLLAEEAEVKVRDVKVITNSLAIAEVLGDRLNEHPIVLGGRYRPQGKSLVGPLAVACLERFRVDTAFIGVTGINSESVFAADIGETEVKSEVIRRATRVILPMDHSKIGITGFVTVCPLSSVDTIVTNRPDAQLSEWSQINHVTVAVPDPD